jgi:Domain of unknown function (DUF4328)
MTSADENPYRPPADPEGPTFDPHGAADEEPYLPGEGRARSTINLLKASIWLAALGVLDTVVNTGISSLISLISAVISVATAVTFCLWFHRAYTNVQRAFQVRGLRYSPRWSVWGFFVPLVNFVVPYVCGREIWIGSHPGVQSINDATARRVGTGIVTLWWSLFLAAQLASIAGGLAQTEEGFARLALALLICANLATVVGAVVTIRMIRRVEQNQGERGGKSILELLTPKPAPPVESNLRSCPHCSRRYDPDDYAVDVPHIYCDHCKGELPRAREDNA